MPRRQVGQSHTEPHSTVCIVVRERAQEGLQSGAQTGPASGLPERPKLQLHHRAQAELPEHPQTALRSGEDLFIFSISIINSPTNQSMQGRRIMFPMP